MIDYILGFILCLMIFRIFTYFKYTNEKILDELRKINDWYSDQSVKLRVQNEELMRENRELAEAYNEILRDYVTLQKHM